MATKTEISNAPYHGFEFGPVIAGSIVAIAITGVLTQFAASIGYTIDSPLRGEGFVTSWGVIAVGVWVLLTQLLSSLTGGYIAGRLRPINTLYKHHEIEMRDGMHGLATWALSTVIVMAGLGIASAISSALVVADPATAVEELTRAQTNSVIVYGFIHAAMSLVAAVLSWWAATKGGEHRDTQIDLSHAWSFKTK